MDLEKVEIEDGKLNSEEIEVIQKTWEKVGDSVEMAIDFYNRLFYLYPALRPLFKEDIRLQARKFTAHISYLVKHMHDWESIQADVNSLGKRHENYEVKPIHYAYVREALFYALTNHLKEDWSLTAELAWDKFYKIVADRMMG